MEACPGAAEHCANELKRDRGFVQEAVKYFGSIIRLAPEAFRDDC